jgi:hypothetical protein
MAAWCLDGVLHLAIYTYYIYIYMCVCVCVCMCMYIYFFYVYLCVYISVTYSSSNFNTGWSFCSVLEHNYNFIFKFHIPKVYNCNWVTNSPTKESSLEKDEYTGNIMYSRVKMTKWDLLKLSQEWGCGVKENDGREMNSTMIYCKNFCTCHNVPPVQQ